MSKRPPPPDHVVQAVAEAMTAAGTADLETLARVAVATAVPHLAAASAEAALDEARAVARELARICPMRVIPLDLMDRMRALPWLLDGDSSE